MNRTMQVHPKRRPPRWVVIVIAMLAVHAVSMLIVVWIATKGGSGAIPGYYQKALDWDRTHPTTRQSEGR